MTTTFYRGLRRTNRVYNSPQSFLTDHANLLQNNVPSGFNLLNNPTTRPGPNNTTIPGYGNNTNFTSNQTVNRVMRNNDLPAMRQIFPTANADQLTSLGNLRQIDNVPDATIHSLSTKKDAVRLSNPETATRTRAGVQNVLDRNPRLNQHLKTVGIAGIAGASIYLIVNIADMVGSIVDAMNRTGGSWWYRGNNGATTFNNIDGCILRYRSCGMNIAEISEHLCQDPADPNWKDPILTDNEALTLCQGYNLAAEETVCRASDPNAEVGSLGYYDPHELATNSLIQCVEPYDMADLIADLGLDNFLGDNGILTNSSGSIRSVSDNFFTILLIVGGVILILFVMYVVIKMLGRSKS